MSTRNTKTTMLKRTALLATIAAVAVTMSQPSMAAPSSTSKAPVGVVAKTGTSNGTDFSSQRRRYGRGGGYGGAAVGAAVAGIVGTAIIASQANRGYGYADPYDSYAYSPGYDGYGQGYYDGGPRYYGRGYGPDRSTLGGQGTNGRLYPNW